MDKISYNGIFLICDGIMIFDTIRFFQCKCDLFDAILYRDIAMVQLSFKTVFTHSISNTNSLYDFCGSMTVYLIYSIPSSPTLYTQTHSENFSGPDDISL